MRNYRGIIRLVETSKSRNFRLRNPIPAINYVRHILQITSFYVTRYFVVLRNRSPKALTFSDNSH